MLSGKFLFLLTSCRGVVGRTTSNVRVRLESASALSSLLCPDVLDTFVWLHWLDNYAKCYAANSIFINKEQFRSMLWTAHGMKKLPVAQDMSWVAKAPGVWLPALPSLSVLLDQQVLDDLFTSLASIERQQWPASFVVLRNVVRIPLKPSPATPEEKGHLDASCDGLRYFHPVDIYPENVASSVGLLAVLHRLQSVLGFGVPGHRRFGFYSLMHVDVAIFWQLLRLLYCYTGMAPVRQDLFLCLGFWHPYLYGHIAIWNEFRHTFLASAFFSLFPNQKLLRRPKLSHSATLFTWLRLVYVHLQPVLTDALGNCITKMITFEIDRTRAIRDGKAFGKTENPLRPMYIHLLNLQTLFEFCLPVLQDYGSLLKFNDFERFKLAFHRLLLLFVLCQSKGSGDYQRTMFVFALLLRYWEDNGLPVHSLLKANHTLFSEESGEIALSALARGTPSASRTDLTQVRHHWQLVRMNYDFHQELRHDDVKREKKKRKLSTLPSFCLFLSVKIF